jgi:hypothetical protein
MDKAFLQTRIDKTKLLIIAYEDAALALLGGVESYSLDTSQSKQTVTQIDALKINQMIDSLYNRLATLQARLNGGGVTVVPGW